MGNIAQSTKLHKPFRYRLRWKYEYINSADRAGMWSRPSENSEEGFKSKAWAQPQQNLLWAVIEGQDASRPGKVFRLAEVPGEDFMNFQWLAVAQVPLGGAGGQNIRGAIQGMSLQSRYEKITVYIDGTVDKRAVTDYERYGHFKKFKR